jgi:lipopolysaccharide export system protein LptA
MKNLCLLICLQLGCIMSLHGQGASRLSTPSGSDTKRQLEQAAERLRAAQKSGELDRAKTTAKELLKNLPPGVTDAAKSALQTPEARAQAIEAAKAAAGSALPQFQGMISGQAADTPPPAAPAPSAPVVQEQPPAAPSGPVPGALPPLSPAAEIKGAPTVVIEADRTDFDLNTAVFIYSGHVRARHPDFYIECEELEVHMVKEEPAGKGQTKASPKPLLSKDGSKQDKDPPIKKAIARGPMVIIEKRSLEGDIQQGRCKRLDYDGATKEIVLSDYPQVQKGNVLHSATTADTVMIFDKEGRLRTNGRPRTVILSDGQPGSPNNAQ